MHLQFPDAVSAEIFVKSLTKLIIRSLAQPGSGGFSGMDFSGIQVPQSGPSTPNRAPPLSVGMRDDPAMIRDMLLANPDQLALLQQNNPALAEAVLSGSLGKWRHKNFVQNAESWKSIFVDNFATVLRRQFAEKQQAEQQKIKLMSASPFDSEAQRLIAEEIRRKNIEANMEAAIEYNPETFGTVIMLYINCKVNGYPVKAFIDSGAQATIMSSAAAERCNIMRLVDVRWAGIAKGVGVQRIIGRIHMVQIQIENDFLTSSFSVLEQQPMDMLLGLDMLKRHQCSIDLKNSTLLIGTTGTTTNFLTESELPDCARLTGSPEEEKRALEESTRMQEELEMREVLEKSAKESGKSSASTSSSSAAPVDNNQRVLPTDKFTENDVADLMKNGFKRPDVIGELRKFNGDKTQALAALFAKSFVF
jgi:DNA damage-inducible protein 1